MKRILFFLACLLPLSLLADNVSEKQAKELAKSFLSSVEGSRSNAVALEMVYDGTDTRSIGEYPAFYVFNNTIGKGFVIISGDDCVKPILGYSYDNNFKSVAMPENLQAWFTFIKDQVRFVRDHKLSASPEISRAWQQSFSRNEVKPVVKLLTASWNQDSPYNDQTPVFDGQRCLTGCVNTALAIIMRYHKWPLNGRGTLPSYEYVDARNIKRVIPARELGEAYDWDSMPLIYNEFASDMSKQQVARLMADCGTMNKTIYSPTESGASVFTLLKVLSSFMDYDKSMWMVNRNDYPLDTWLRILKDELKSGRPILYSGYRNIKGADGHAFVLDGYDADNFFSVNWGWGGVSNGYFQIDALYVGKFDFNYLQSAILGIQKNTGGGYNEIFRFSSCQAMNVLASHIKTGEEFLIHTTWVSLDYSSTDSEDFTFSYWLVDSKGNMKEKISQDLMVKTLVYPLGTISCTIKKGFQANDRIRLYFKSKNTTQWKQVLERNGGESEVEILGSNGDVGHFIKKVPLDFNRKTGLLKLGVTKDMSVEIVNFNDDWKLRTKRTDTSFIFDTKGIEDTNFFIKIKEGKRKLYTEIRLSNY